MVSLDFLSNTTSTAQSLSNLILVKPENKGIQPQSSVNPQAPQPPKFLFNYEGEQSVELKSDITDHFLEDNTAIQDQIAKMPELVSTNGFIGELTRLQDEISDPIREARDRALVFAAYQPELTVAAERAFNDAERQVNTFNQLQKSAVSGWSTLNGQRPEVLEIRPGESLAEFEERRRNNQNTQNKQQIAFQQFYGYWRSNTLFTVQTPWAIFTNMAIQNLRAVQGEDTNVITSFEITFKAMRFAKTTTTPDLDISLSERIQNQQAGEVENYKNLTPGATLGEVNV